MSTGQIFMLGVLGGWVSLGVLTWLMERFRPTLTPKQFNHMMIARVALERCRAQFAFYSAEHVNKGSLEKAETNRGYAMEADAGVREIEKLMEQGR